MSSNLLKVIRILFLGILLFILFNLYPKNTQARHIITNVDDCATSTCPTGDASIGVNFTVLPPLAVSCSVDPNPAAINQSVN